MGTLIMLKRVWTWIKNNLLSIALSIALIGVLCYHFFGTYNPPITQTVMVSPIATTKNLDNGQQAQVKVNTPDTSTPEESGFSEQFVKDTIGKVLGIKEKQILAINKVQGKYKDSLQLYKTELDEQKRLTKYYQSKDSKGNVIGNAKVTGDGPLVYEGDINLISVVKKGTKKSPDSLIFYDPNQRVTINKSKEFTYLVTEKKRSKLKIAPSIGIGAIVPISVDNGKFKTKNIGLGFYGGIGVSYTF